MKKVYRAVQTGHNRWEKKTRWEFSGEEKAGLCLLLLVAGYVIIRAIIG